GDTLLLVLLALAYFAGVVVILCSVVLVVGDGTAHIVLLLVDLLTLLRGEAAVVCCLVGADLLVDVCLAILAVTGLMRCELAGGDAVGDALLLIFAACVHRGHRKGLRTSVVDGGELAAVRAHGLLVSKLTGGGLEVVLVESCRLGG